VICVKSLNLNIARFDTALMDQSLRKGGSKRHREFFMLQRGVEPRAYILKPVTRFPGKEQDYGEPIFRAGSEEIL